MGICEGVSREKCDKLHLGQKSLYICVCRFNVVRPFDQPYGVFITECLLLPVKFLPFVERIFPAEEFHREIMLDSLVFDGRLKRRNIEIQTLSSEPFRPVLIEGIRIAFSKRLIGFLVRLYKNGLYICLHTDPQRTAFILLLWRYLEDL